MNASDTPVDELGYEQARDELIDVVRVLEQGGLDLDASLALWERGEKLAKRCEFHLDGARARIEKALQEDGEDHGGQEDRGAPADAADSTDAASEGGSADG